MTNSKKPSNVISPLLNAAACVLAWFVALLICFAIFALIGCRSTRRVEAERVNISQVAASQVDHRRSVLLASSLPLSLPIASQSETTLMRSCQPSPVSMPAWVLAVEETTSAGASDVQQRQHWEVETPRASVKKSIVYYVLAAIAFCSALVAVGWLRKSRL